MSFESFHFNYHVLLLWAPMVVVGNPAVISASDSEEGKAEAGWYSMNVGTTKYHDRKFSI